MNHKNKISFGLLQYKLIKNFKSNHDLVFKYLDELALKKPNFIVLPEMWLGTPSKPFERQQWACDYSIVLKEACRWCKKNHSGLFFSQLELIKNQYFNTAYFLDEKGTIKGRYRKIHLFRLAGEDKIYSEGSEVKVFISCIGPIGHIVCYDIRFPELIRSLAIGGIRLLIVSAQWPESRSEHWLALLKARAIENQIFVIAVNRLGKKEQMTYCGQSVVFDPWGNQRLMLSKSKKMGTVTIDLNEVEQIRKKYPFFNERRGILSWTP